MGSKDENKMRLNNKNWPDVVVQIKANHSKITITISIGVAQSNIDMEDARQLIKNADIFLYKAKNSGKNRGCSLSNK